MHDHTNDLFSQSRVRTPDLAARSFCGSRVQTPALAAQSFCGSRAWFPRPDCLFFARCILGLLQATFALTVPQNVKQLRRFQGMVQYTETCGQDEAKYCHPSPTLSKNVGTPKPHGLPRQSISSGIGMMCIRPLSAT